MEFIENHRFTLTLFILLVISVVASIMFSFSTDTYHSISFDFVSSILSNWQMTSIPLFSFILGGSVMYFRKGSFKASRENQRIVDEILREVERRRANIECC